MRRILSPRGTRRRLAGIAVVAVVAAPGSAATSAGAACRHLDVTVSVAWSHERADKVSGVVTRVHYPAALEVATDQGSDSARAQVELLTGTSGGLFDALRKDSGEGGGGVLNIGLITAGIGSGPFARVRFGCRPGGATPAAGDFTCVADVADEAGSVPATCSVAIKGE